MRKVFKMFSFLSLFVRFYFLYYRCKANFENDFLFHQQLFKRAISKSKSIQPSSVYFDQLDAFVENQIDCAFSCLQVKRCL